MTEKGTLAPGCVITYFPTPEGSMVNTSKEVVIFRGVEVKSTRYGRFSREEVAELVLQVRTFLAAEKLLDKLGMQMPDGVDEEVYKISGVGRLHISTGSTLWVKTKGFRSFDSDGDLHFNASSEHCHRESYPLPVVWVKDRFGRFGQMDAQKALDLLSEAAI